MVQPRNQGHLMPESTRQMQHRDARVPGSNLSEDGERMITAPVYHINRSKSVPLRKTGQDTRKRLVKDRQPLFLIVNG
jgi:hypothetical protein